MVPLVETSGDWLPNLRYRGYFFTTGGVLHTEGLKTADVERFPAWQVRLRTALREARKKRPAAMLSLLFSSTQTLSDYHQSGCHQRDVLASLSALSVTREQQDSLLIVDGAQPERLNPAMTSDATRRYIIVSFDDICLHPAAPAAIAQAAHRNGFPPILYSQHVGASGECVVKPEFDPVFFATYDFIGPAVFFREDLYQTLLATPCKLSALSLYQMVAKQISAGETPVRIDEFLVMSGRQATVLSEVSTHYQTMKTEASDTAALRQWHYPVTDAPLVSVIVPTYNGLNVLRPCIESLLTATSYPNTEIIVIDNNSDDKDTLNYLSSVATRGVRVIRYPYPFNYSAINNFAASKANGDVLCLLNNDVEVIEPDWLNKMVCWARLSDVGAVGAKLLYGSGRIQHAGVVVGMGNAAGHLHRLEEHEQTHHGHRISQNQMMTAVTAACLVVERTKFDKVGGLDEKHLAVAYNDIDLCLKLNQCGYQTLYCADAVLYHHESVSRGDDLSDDKIKRYMRELRYFQKNWRVKQLKDRTVSKHWDRHMERVPKLTAPVDAFTCSVEKLSS
ncbi:glycosyltransferase family 2 protein [Alteromonas halophila]|uniref:glycosyltransferase family 2 protein n=1 Tax=Alteromonas halophila TaxID=516698 RepID=UPI00167408F9|nr:glycosyltransferase family 2 protein [Alteromonas halophila]